MSQGRRISSSHRPSLRGGLTSQLGCSGCGLESGVRSPSPKASGGRRSASDWFTRQAVARHVQSRLPEAWEGRPDAIAVSPQAARTAPARSEPKRRGALSRVGSPAFHPQTSARYRDGVRLSPSARLGELLEVARADPNRVEHPHMR